MTGTIIAALGVRKNERLFMSKLGRVFYLSTKYSWWPVLASALYKLCTEFMRGFHEEMKLNFKSGFQPVKGHDICIMLAFCYFDRQFLNYVRNILNF